MKSNNNSKSRAFYKYTSLIIPVGAILFGFIEYARIQYMFRIREETVYYLTFVFVAFTMSIIIFHAEGILTARWKWNSKWDIKKEARIILNYGIPIYLLLVLGILISLKDVIATIAAELVKGLLSLLQLSGY